MTNFSPVVAYRIGPYFRCWCVKEYLENGKWRTVNVCDIKELAMVRLAERAARRKGMVVADDGESAAMRQDALKCD